MAENHAARHFTALDGWRGICACLVALFHLNAYSIVTGAGLIRNAFFYVDFFFVLSGFVIAASYGAALRQGFGIGRFMLLRFGRLYPLHLVTLAAFVAIECAGFVAPGLEPAGKLPFTGEGRTLGALVANLFLVQGLDTQTSLSWNYPSWSISVEFATYFLFSLAATALPRSPLRIALLIVAIAAPMAVFRLSPHDFNVTYNYGILRAVAGFAAGALVFDLFVYLTKHGRAVAMPASAMSIVEVAAVCLAVIFVSVAGSSVVAFAAPLVFAIVVLVFAFEGGMVSRVLMTRPAMVVGALSYSIYMVHAPFEHVALMGARLVERMTSVTMFTTVMVDGTSVRMIGTTLWWGAVATVLVLAGTIALSAVTYRWIEMPARLVTRRLAKRWFAIEARTAGGAIATP